MKVLTLCLVLFGASSVFAQTTASTACTTNGNITNCDTAVNTVNVPGPANRMAVTNNPTQAPAGAGWLYGAANATPTQTPLSNWIVRRRVKSYCHKHPANGTWHFPDGFVASCSDINKVMGWK